MATYIRAPLAFIEGRLAEADALAEQTLEIGQRAGHPDALLFYSALVEDIREAQGIGEVIASVCGAWDKTERHFKAALAANERAPAVYWRGSAARLGDHAHRQGATGGSGACERAPRRSRRDRPLLRIERDHQSGWRAARKRRPTAAKVGLATIPWAELRARAATSPPQRPPVVLALYYPWYGGPPTWRHWHERPSSRAQ